MIRHLTCSADTYISRRVIDGAWRNTANVGQAGTLDLYKLYDQTRSIQSGSSVPNTELTRLLLTFDDSWLMSAHTSGSLVVTHSSFRATLIMRDAYGGQPVPKNLTVMVWPLSRSFAEGDGRDIVLMSDSDEANWLTASSGVAWSVTGCGLGGTTPAPCDYFTSSSGGQYSLSGVLRSGIEDLLVDVTRLVRERVSGEIPALSVLVRLPDSAESDQRSYFVKRFSSRHAHDQSQTPRIALEWDESLWDDTTSPVTDERITLLAPFYRAGRLTSITSGSQLLTGSSCMTLALISGAWSSSYTASQHSGAAGPVPGVYSASFTLSSDDAVVGAALSASGSFTARPMWLSLGGKMLREAAPVTFTMPSAAPARPTDRLYVSFIGLRSEYHEDEMISVRVSVFDPGATSAAVVKQPRVQPTVVIRSLSVAPISATTKQSACERVLESSLAASLLGDSYYWSLHASALPRGESLRLIARADGVELGDMSPAFTVLP